MSNDYGALAKEVKDACKEVTQLSAGQDSLRGEVSQLRKEVSGLSENQDSLRKGQDNLRDEIRHLGVQAEDTNSKLTAILEIIAPKKEQIDKIPKIENDIDELKAGQLTIKSAIKATNSDVRGHEHRITRLETKAA
jgi:chromosome segregation ATPase